ncbi:hypothetical protein ACEYYA_01575 [Paracoccus sp. p3-h83]|uniref:hypothetical protein n=1 Tax=Paracoccus sp. p3-h83 TaxID=3342805 RepID=UPI0035B900AD
MRNPFLDSLMAPVTLGCALLQLGMDSQRVIALRSAGLMGIWSMPPGEAARMVSEKSQAAALSMRAASLAMARGETPDRVVQAALKPVSRKAHANATRLTRQGLRAKRS